MGKIMNLTNLTKQNKFLNIFLLVMFLLFGLYNNAVAETDQDKTKADTNKIETVASEDSQTQDFTTVVLPKEKQTNTYDLNLEQSINLALLNNNIYNIQKKQTKIFKIQATKTVLDFLPDLNTAMSYSYQSEIADIGQTNLIIPGLGPISFAGFQVEDNWKRQNTVSATQSLTGLIKKYYNHRIADLSFQRALLEEEYSSENTTLHVYESYFNVLESQYQIEAAKKNVEELKSYYDIAYSRYKEGTALKRDAQKVEVELDKAQYYLFVRENSLENNLNIIKNILGLSQSDNVNIQPTYNNLENQLPLDEAINIAIENNQRVKQSELDIDIARNTKKREYTRYIPDFNVNVCYLNQKGSDFYPNNNFLLTFNMDFNFFDWGKRELTIKERRLQIEQAKLASKDLIEKIQIEIKERYKDVDEAKMLIKVSEKAVNLAKTNVDISSNRYKVGMELITDVLSDQSDLAEARTEYYSSLFNEQKTIAQLKKALGILFPSE